MWTQNRWGGWHSATHFCGESWRGYWNVWCGDRMVAGPFRSAADAKAWAEAQEVAA